jgi:hypothetical protein
VTGTDRIVELCKGAMMAAAQVHADREQKRYEAWKADRTKGKKRWEPHVDRAELIATFEDLFGSAMDAVRKEVARDN